jgi:pimeloyl-ACP methyl ester carboxylesterase
MAYSKRWLIVAGIILVLALALTWLATTDNTAIWPVRNTLQYRVLTWWWAHVGQPTLGGAGTLRGTVRDSGGQPIEGARVLVARRDGTTYNGRSDADGAYAIPGIPVGAYRPVAGAPGYESVTLGGLWVKVKIRPGKETAADIVLPVEIPRNVVPGRDLKLGEPTKLTCTKPIETSAVRRQITFDSAGQPNQLTLFYTPVTVTTTSQLPILLAVYPGPADSWECASIPLAAAGYAVLAAGPAYSFDLEAEIDELERLLDFARAGQFPGSDGSRIAVLGGSYSSLHVQRLLQRRQKVQAALLLGAPTDLFDMRRRLENGTYVPPFGLDQALIALGFPDCQPLRYWRYSGAYHVHQDLPPLAVIYSRSDDVVPYQQSELLAANLAMVGASFETHSFDGASHYLLSDEEDDDSLKIYKITLDFLARHLK